MPKTDMDYSNTIIYKFVCNDLNIKDCYVGHTTNFIKRKASHKKVCNNSSNKKHNYKVYSFIRENGGWDNWVMIEIEKYSCNDKNEACARERYWYETLNASLNSRYPSRNRKEYMHDNKEKHSVKHKEYYEGNKDLIKSKYSTEYKCMCGSTITQNCKSRHYKSIKHLKYMESSTA